MEPGMTATAKDASSILPALVAAEEALLALAGVAVERGEVLVNGVRLHYLTCGEGEPLLMLHGRGNAGALFAPIFAPLAAQRKIYALDLPGWGLSDKPRFTGRTAQDALAIWREGALGFLEALNISRADVLGHSMGGFTAASLALERPDRVRRLILVDPGGIGERKTRFDARLYFWLKPERLNRWWGKWLTRRILTLDSHGQQPPSALDERVYDFTYAVMAQRAVIPSGAAAFNAWAGLGGAKLTLTRRLPELRMPTLLMWGQRDFVTPYANAHDALGAIPNGRLVTFASNGHSPHQERPAVFARILGDWLDGRDAPEQI
jgi:4,5:9,10-diseco-3-hydroxy-5,9,17-trioxoandrosta-1(10),2-diene-4-oate hydrolase